MSDVGYRKPPKDKQFKKGTSGNPSGRPKGSKNITTLLTKELNKSIVITENGKKKKMTRQEAMVLRVVNSALNGDIKCLMTCIDIQRKEGQKDSSESENVFAEGYEAVLADYIVKQDKNSKAKKPTGGKGGE